MAYLYAVMGVVMMTGIMAIFELGLSLTGQSVLPALPDPYVSSPQAKALDRDLLKLVANPNSIGQDLRQTDLCEAIRMAYSDSSSLNLMEIKSGRFKGGCSVERDFVVNSATVFHRVLIQPPALGAASLPYKLFSCTSDQDNQKCSFERG